MIQRLKKILRNFIQKQKEGATLKAFISSEIPKINAAEVVFFFPFYGTGGAEKIHLKIVEALLDPHTYVLFTGKSKNNSLWTHFNKAANCFDVYSFIKGSEKNQYKFNEALIKALNTNKSLQSVFGCNSFYFYDILEKLAPTIKKIDLIHAFSAPDYGIEDYSEKSIEKLDKRIVINKRTYNDLIKQYETLSLSKDLVERIQIIENGLLGNTEQTILKKDKAAFTVGFVGRWSKEKRPQLFLEVAKKVKKQTPEIHFVMAGTDVKQHEGSINDSGVDCKGEIINKNLIEALYAKMHILVITSYREGFPLVIMEGMQHGVAIVATDVGSIHEHVHHSKTGFIVENSNNEQQIVDHITERILELYYNPELWNQISENVKVHAATHFGIERFNTEYRKLLVSN